MDIATDGQQRYCEWEAYSEALGRDSLYGRAQNEPSPPKNRPDARVASVWLLVAYRSTDHLQMPYIRRNAAGDTRRVFARRLPAARGIPKRGFAGAEVAGLGGCVTSCDTRCVRSSVAVCSFGWWSRNSLPLGVRILLPHASSMDIWARESDMTLWLWTRVLHQQLVQLSFQLLDHASAGALNGLTRCRSGYGPITARPQCESQTH